MVRSITQAYETGWLYTLDIPSRGNPEVLEIESYMTTREYISPDKGYVVLGLITTGPDCWSDLISKISLLIIGPQSEPEKYDIEISLHGQHDAMSEPEFGRTPVAKSNTGIPISEALLKFQNTIGEYYLVGNNILNLNRAFLVEAVRRHRRSSDQVSRIIDEVDDLPIRRFIDLGDIHKGLSAGLTPEPAETIANYSRRCRSFITNMNNVEISDICRRLELTQNESLFQNPTDSLETEKLVFETFFKLFD